MSYTNPNKKYSGAYGGQKKFPSTKTAAAKEKKYPDKDIVAVDSEGNIMKGPDGFSLRIGSIWSHENGNGFVMFDREPLEAFLQQEKLSCKIFVRKTKKKEE